MRLPLATGYTTTELDEDSDTDDGKTARSSGSMSTPKIFGNRNSSHSVKLPAFKGESDEKWKAYINRFEAVAQHNGWTDREKLGQLLPRLQGHAGEFVFEELGPTILSNYKKLLKELESRFGIIETNKTYQTKFRRRDQKNGESVQDYAVELKSLYNKAYPDRGNKTKQEDLVSRFLLGLSSEKARLHVELNRDPFTIEEATEFVIEYEEATRYPRADDERKYAPRKGPVRQVLSSKDQLSQGETSYKDSKNHTKNWNKSGQHTEPKGKSPSSNLDKQGQKGSESDFITKTELKQVIQEVLTAVQPNSGSQVQRPRKPLSCFRCGEQGHFARNCSSEKKQEVMHDNAPLNPGANVFKPSLN